MLLTSCDTLVDITQNAFESGASNVRVQLARNGTWLAAEVQDNGRGMDAPTLQKARDTFWTDGVKHPGRKDGMGLPFVKQAAEQCGGVLEIASEPDHGTTVRFTFDLSRVNAPALGDVPATLAGLMAWPGEHELTVRREENGRAFEVRRTELEDALGHLDTAGSLVLMREYFLSNEEEIGNEVQHGEADIS